MRGNDVLVSVGLPVRNAADRLERVIGSVLAQDHEHIRLVVSDNASTDDTEELCRELARSDRRILYHRQTENVGILNNFITVMRLAEGDLFRWVGDDDWLAPHCVSRMVDVFARDERLLLVTSQTAYTGPDGVTESAEYVGTGLTSDDPVDRFAEMLRMLNESHLLIDPLYGMVRRDRVVAIARRNMLREDEVFAAKLALAGPWAHVPEVLGHRHWKHERMPEIARRLDVPPWQAHFASVLQCVEMLRWLSATRLTAEQRRRARRAVYGWYARRQWRTTAHRGRKLIQMASGALTPRPGAGH
ncbi:glycosyltransferase family 2 protein [Sphaerimonospora thailandensis]|uniref:Glycosyltransferase 2-like domain-containing protein n=1 Tax=Sphaerimonospora thailandensis TaxID=795644 RepID=A0A8J3VY23_9ACTN|nr:glycosyltransferase family 2 protein [Sphaerimonospora thailandensis]GIH69062.1 hypothetical protein Mth01_13150 [Sphaerimonospora thailandensis]